MSAATESGVLMHEDPILEELELENGYGCCFQSCWPSGKRRVISDDDHWNLLQRREREELWIVTRLKKLKNASEVIAGPKWKNLLRKIGAYFNQNTKRKDFQYDSFNYTLNFDYGVHEDDEDGGALGFSSRFAPPVMDRPRSST